MDDSMTHAATRPAAGPRISVVMPTFRRPLLLLRCLNALLAQTLPAAAFEIVVVDDGRTEDARAACESVAREAARRGGPAIRYLRPEGQAGPAAARNVGWRAAAGRLIAFTDDDTLPDPDWLRAGDAAMTVPGRMAAWGYVRVPVPAALTDNARNTANMENGVFLTANAFVMREALEAVGGFDERYRRAWREDTDLYFALLARYGHEGAVVPAPAARVVHPVREARFLVSLGQQANMAFDALLFKKYPALYDRHVGMRHPPLDYSIIVAATIAGVVALPFWGLAAGVLWAIALRFILKLALRRQRGLSKAPRQVADVLLSSFAIPYLSLYWRAVGALRWRVAFY